MPYELVALLGCCAGLCFACIGISYKAGQSVGIAPMQTFMFSAFIGSLVYGIQGIDQFANAPLILYILAIVAGFFQYLVVRMVRVVLKFGPLSPVWSSLMLSFIPTVIYSSVVLGEPFTTRNFFAVACSIIAVLSAAKNAAAQCTATADNKNNTPVFCSMGIYASLLVVLIGCDMMLGVSMKQLETMQALNGNPLMKECKMAFLGVMYLSLAVPLLIDSSLTKVWNFKSRRWIPLTMLATGGTLGGMWLISTLINYPAALVFTCNSGSSVLTAALAGALIFKEIRTKWWYLTIIATILTFLISNGEFFLSLLGS